MGWASCTKLGTALVALLAVAGCDEGDQGRGPGAWVGEADDPNAPQSSPDDVPPESRIYGGAPVGACGWPTTVSLGGSCSGTLVHPEVVIYAAHCGDDYTSVRFGEKISGGQGRNVPVSFCEIYPAGGPGNGRDYAFCKLAQPVTDVPIVPIAMGCETDEIAPGKAVTMVGFGEADNGPYGTKRWVNSTVSSISAQREVFIGGAGKDTCQGDSGGPVFMQVDDGNGPSWRVFGITSYGGACGGGGYYSQMHHGVAWFEDMSGEDLTPCHDADGTWNPGPDCTEFPVTPNVGSGTWANGCSGGPVTGASETCGEGIDQGDNQQEPEPPACDSCITVQGTLSGANDRDVQPNGNYYYAASSGNHIANLDGPGGVDFDLTLLKWGNNRWNTVASATTSAPDETMTYAGTAGYYAWIVKSYAGSGSYTLELDTP
jgi:hypothetical protein